MDDLAPAALALITRLADDWGVSAPTTEEVVALLALAGAAAHASHRQAAPVACWLAARAGLSPDEALARLRALG